MRETRALLGDDPELSCECLPDDFLDELDDIPPDPGAAQTCATPEPAAQASRAPWAIGNSLDDIELQAVKLALKTHRGNVSAAARQLGISRNTLYRKLKQSSEPEFR